MGWLRWAAGGSVEGGVAEGEDPSVACDEPVALAVGGGGDADDGLVEVGAASGSVEGGVAEGEDPSVSGDEPVALAVWGGGDADDGLVEVGAASGPVKRGVKGEDPPVGGDQPVVVHPRHDRFVRGGMTCGSGRLSRRRLGGEVEVGGVDAVAGV